MARQIVQQWRFIGESLRRLAMVAALWCAAVPACGQDQGERTRITDAEFHSHMAELDLPIAQREAAETMFAEYTREFDDALKMCKDVLNWVWSNSSEWCGGISPEGFSHTEWMEQQLTNEHWERGARELESQYFKRLHEIAIGLDDTVESFRRAHLRNRYLKGYYPWEPAPGASIDLIFLAGKADPAIPSKTDVQVMLHNYELAMDEILRKYDETMIGHRTRVQLAGDVLNDAKKAGQDVTVLAEQYADLVMSPEQQLDAVVDLNLKSSEQVLAALPPEQQTRLRDVLAVDMHAYARPEHGLPPERAFDSALGGPNLTDDQRAHLLVLRDSYRHMRDAAFPELFRIHRRTFDFREGRNSFFLSVTGHQTEAMERWNEVQKSWDDAKGDWVEKCTKVLKAIDAIVGPTMRTEP